MGLLAQYPIRRLGRLLNTTGVVIAFLLIWTFRDVLRLDLVGFGSSLDPWIPHRQPADHFDFPALDSDDVRAVCAATEWDAGSKLQVVFTCDNSVGGVGNIRNSVLNCVRWAMLAGGSLVLPRIVVRNDSDISVIRTGAREGLDYMFDRAHFVDSLRLSCPQLRLFNSTDDVQRALGPSRTWSQGLFPEKLAEVDEGDKTSDGIPHPERWRAALHRWLGSIDNDTDVAPTGQRSEGPMIVDLGRSYLTYPIYSDGAGFATSFGNILKFHADARRLATATVLRIGGGSGSGGGGGGGAVPAHFFGAHLRTEKDALDSWNPIDPLWAWSEYPRQTEAYLTQAAAANLSVIYVASGNATQVALFAEEARASHGITVTTKQQLLTGSDRKLLDKLAWDQQALVDFLVMLAAVQFGGVGHSSFAWNVALRRHTFAKQQKGHLDGPQMLSDDLSQIYGEPKKYPEYAACLWP